MFEASLPAEVPYLIGGGIIAALLTAVIQPIWTHLIGDKSKLSVKVDLNRFGIPVYLKKSIREYSELQWNRKASFRPPKDAIRRLEAICFYSGLISVKITNKSKSEIQGIRLRVNTEKDLTFQTISPSPQSSSVSNEFTIETLLPQEEIELIIWTQTDYSAVRYGKIEDIVNVTARSIHKIEYKYSKKQFSEHLYFHLSRGFFWTLWWVAIISVPLIINFVNIMNSELVK